MANGYRIRKIHADVVVPDAADSSNTATLADKNVNGLLRGVIILIPSMTASQPVNVTENVTMAESVSLVRI